MSLKKVKQVTLPFTDKASLLDNEDYTLLMVGGTFQEDLFMVKRPNNILTFAAFFSLEWQ